MLNVTRKATYEGITEAEVQIGDQIKVPVEGFGTFTATAEKVTDDSVLFIFDSIVARQPMNKTNTNEGGFKGSQLYKWLQNTLLPAFPEQLRSMISELTIPTVGQIVGHEDEWDNEHFEGDNDEQLPLMKNRKHRMALFGDEFSWYWVQNATKKDWSAAHFAVVNIYGFAHYGNASDSSGVRPAFWLVKDKSRGPVPRKSGRFPWDFNFGMEDVLRYCQNDVKVTEEAVLKMEIQKKAREIDALKKEIEKLEKYKQYDEATTETKVVMDSFIRAGFTEEQAFDMVKTIFIAIFGGIR